MSARRRRYFWWFVGWAIVVVVTLLAGGLAETYRLETAEYTLTSADLPVSFDGTRIVLVTDIHRGPFFSQSRVRSLVERVNALKPDLVVLGGDYVFVNTDYAASCFKELAGLRAPLGTFAVLGNHDYGDQKKGDGPAPVIRAIGDAGITLLRNEATWIEKEGARIRIGGVGDLEEDNPQAAATLAGTGNNDFVILISHEPDYAEKLPAGAVDLMLSGHTHGGQVTFFGLWGCVPSRFGQKYRTGMVASEATTVVVSNGVGTSTIPPLRLFAPPQIVVITLRTVANSHL